MHLGSQANLYRHISNQRSTDCLDGYLSRGQEGDVPDIFLKVKAGETKIRRIGFRVLDYDPDWWFQTTKKDDSIFVEVLISREKKG